MKFTEFNLNPALEKAIKYVGFEEATPIQEQAIPIVISGRDIMGLAQTGSGKTAAFVLPILNQIMSGERGENRALIVVPTRELAKQIYDVVQSFTKQTKIKAIPITGGVAIGPQISKLQKNPEFIIACPGRLLDHLTRRTMNLKGLKFFVLDEADMMMDMGFIGDIKKIITHLPHDKQSMMFSATMPKEIKALANSFLDNPEHVQAGNQGAATSVSHYLYPVAAHLKPNLLIHLLEKHDEGSVLVFTRTKHKARQIAKKLADQGLSSAALQGNLSQSKRQQAMDGFRKGRYRILVATDIASRGIDVSQVSHVINFDIPDVPETYVHRIGRTGRAAQTGDAHTLVPKGDENLVRAIERLLKTKIERRLLEDFDYKGEALKLDPSRDPSERQRPERNRSRPTNGMGRGGRGGRNDGGRSSSDGDSRVSNNDPFGSRPPRQHPSRKVSSAFADRDSQGGRGYGRKPSNGKPSFNNSRRGPGKDAGGRDNFNQASNANSNLDDNHFNRESFNRSGILDDIAKSGGRGWKGKSKSGGGATGGGRGSGRNGAAAGGRNSNRGNNPSAKSGQGRSGNSSFNGSGGAGTKGKGPAGRSAAKQGGKANGNSGRSASGNFAPRKPRESKKPKTFY